eukprot:TRINITY_DN55073_c0_g1_i1.p1 TRINITY_DN55073_c0_g1~~TRINITY_DN55073_c0_g1_i1.p1  ORF type:complete len:1454 (+),score=400.58 TRINITY_DN55073_c0_g1_i1:105-4364(+)
MALPSVMPPLVCPSPPPLGQQPATARRPVPTQSLPQVSSGLPATARPRATWGLSEQQPSQQHPAPAATMPAPGGSKERTALNGLTDMRRPKGSLAALLEEQRTEMEQAEAAYNDHWRAREGSLGRTRRTSLASRGRPTSPTSTGHNPPNAKLTGWSEDPSVCMEQLLVQIRSIVQSAEVRVRSAISAQALCASSVRSSLQTPYMGAAEEPADSDVGTVAQARGLPDSTESQRRSSTADGLLSTVRRIEQILERMQGSPSGGQCPACARRAAVTTRSIGTQASMHNSKQPPQLTPIGEHRSPPLSPSTERTTPILAPQSREPSTPTGPSALRLPQCPSARDRRGSTPSSRRKLAASSSFIATQLGLLRRSSMCPDSVSRRRRVHETLKHALLQVGPVGSASALCDALFSVDAEAVDLATTVRALKKAVVAAASISDPPRVTVWLAAGDGDGVYEGACTQGTPETRGLAAWVRQHEVDTPLALDSATAVATHPGYNPQVDGEPAALLLCPMWWNDACVGVIALCREAGDRAFFDADTAVMCAAIALYAAPHVAQLRPEGDRTTVQLLKCVGSLAEEVLDQHRLMSAVCEHACTLLSAEQCRLWLVDERHQRLTDAGDPSSRLPIDNGSIAGAVALTGMSQKVVDAGTDPRLEGALRAGTVPRTVKRLLYMPVKCGDRTVAVAEIVNRRASGSTVNAQGPFTPADEALFRVFANFAGTALVNCETHAQAQLASEQTASMLELSRQLGAVTLDAEAVKSQVIEFARRLVNADRGALFVVDWHTGDLVGEIGGMEHRVPIAKGIAGAVAASGQSLIISDAYSDPRFFKDIDLHTGYRTHNIVAVPVKFKNQVVAVAQLINKLNPLLHEKGRQDSCAGHCVDFTQEDQHILETFGAIAGIAIRTAEHHRRELREKDKFRAMLGAVASLLKVDIRSDISSFCSSMVNDLVGLVGCEWGLLWIMDKERRVLRSYSAGDEDYVELPVGEGIIGAVAACGKMQSIPDAYADTRYMPAHDERSGRLARNLLCAPVVCEAGMARGEILAVMELANKRDSGFTEDDEATVAYYSSLAAVAMQNSRMFHFEQSNASNLMRLVSRVASRDVTGQPLRPSQDTQRLAHDLLRDHAPTEQEIAALATLRFDVHSYGVTGQRERLLVLAHHMFTASGLAAHFSIPSDTVMTFIVEVHKRYRDVPYHNFLHAFDVMQTLYFMLLQAPGRFSKLEQLVLLVCGLCHDVDHMGLSNSSHYKSESPLGILSSVTGARSPLEIHHCNVMFEVLQQPGAEIFAPLSPQDQTWAFKHAVECILATDMVCHEETCAHYSQLRTDPTDERFRGLTMCMLLKTADLSNVAKPFPISVRWAGLICEEFGGQEGVVHPLCMDQLAPIQLSFIDSVCIPFFRLMTKDLAPAVLLEQCEANRAQWATHKRQ